ncbi:MAG: MOFRL family protein, partial [Pirellulales bacterium]
DAAGAWADSNTLRVMKSQALDPQAFLEINDSYGFFRQVGGLLKTGPTHTNVMDLRVGLIV